MIQNNYISAVVVNYNGISFIGKCLESLLKMRILSELIVVDNGSNDGSLEYLKQNFPEVILIPTENNLGFGRACNIGVHNSRGKFILLFNYDAELYSGLDEALSYLVANPMVGVVGGKLVYPNGQLQPSVGRSLVPLRLILSWAGLSRIFPSISWLSREILDNEWYSNPHQSVEWITGACMLIRRSAWDQVGGMDPAFFLYVEDVDFCDRLKTAGYRLDYLPFLSSMHLKGGGEETVSRRALLSTIDSYNVYLNKHFNRFLSRTTLAGIGLVFLLRAFAFLFRFWRGPGVLHEALTYLKASIRALALCAGRSFPWGPP